MSRVVTVWGGDVSVLLLLHPQVLSPAAPEMPSSQDPSHGYTERLAVSSFSTHSGETGQLSPEWPTFSTRPLFALF